MELDRKLRQRNLFHGRESNPDQRYRDHLPANHVVTAHYLPHPTTNHNNNHDHHDHHDNNNNDDDEAAGHHHHDDDTGWCSDGSSSHAELTVER